MEDATKSATEHFSLRLHHAGDMELIVAKHGEFYSQEYGWDRRFQELVGSITTDFINNYDRTSERCWIAEHEGCFLGCVMLVKERRAEKTAKLRLLLVDPAARGLGLGRTLVRQSMHFAQETGYARITLWTNSILTSAQRIYRSEGYKLVREEEHETFGPKLTGQYWELDLSR
jgi:GNAT superfamily N-acetyltransferase